MPRPWRVDPNLVLARYATERLLYRLSRSSHADRFVLKGGLLLLAWLGEAIRPEDPYGGRRLTLFARLGSARLRVQVDVGIGDAVTPEPEMLDYPSLLDLPRPRLRAYRPESAVAEKIHAMVSLGSKNSRMRDFFDVRALARNLSFDGAALAESLRTTFEHRNTAIPKAAPLALTPAYARIEGKRAQWAGFLRRSRISSAPAELEAVIDAVASFAGPVLSAAGRGERFDRSWPPGGRWERGRRGRET